MKTPSANIANSPISEGHPTDATLLYEGKAKQLFQVPGNPQHLLHVFKDDITANNGQKHSIIPGKGEVNAQICEVLFNKLHKNGITTHFIEAKASNTHLIQRLEMLKIEFVVRNIATGSLTRRYGIKPGEQLKQPLVEMFYKDDSLGDPLIAGEHATALSLATQEQLATAVQISLKINEALCQIFSKCGLTLIDFKIELGTTPTQQLILGDELSPDTMRLWQSGTSTSMDKDIYRKGTEEGLISAYRQVLAALKQLPA